MPLSLDHLLPVAAGGLTVRENLWLACRSCNEHKGDRTRAEDTVTGEVVALFNPRATGPASVRTAAPCASVIVIVAFAEAPSRR